MRSFIGQLLLAVLAVLLLGGCEATHDILAVQQDDKALAHFSLSELEDLPQVEIATPQSRGEQVQRGPTVRSVLDAAGATRIESVRFEGRDPAQTLTTAELTDQVILNVTKRNTLKLTGAKLGVDRWVRDVTALIVNP
jgi:hypothetical protein